MSYPSQRLQDYEAAPARVLDESGNLVGEVIVVVHAETHQWKIQWLREDGRPQPLSDPFPLAPGRYTIEGFEVID